jgi:hypothetical protein
VGDRCDPTDDIAIPADLVTGILDEEEHHDKEGGDITTMIE